MQYLLLLTLTLFTSALAQEAIPKVSILVDSNRSTRGYARFSTKQIVELHISIAQQPANELIIVAGRADKHKANIYLYDSMLVNLDTKTHPKSASSTDVKVSTETTHIFVADLAKNEVIAAYEFKGKAAESLELIENTESILSAEGLKDRVLKVSQHLKFPRNQMIAVFALSEQERKSLVEKAEAKLANNEDPTPHEYAHYLAHKQALAGQLVGMGELQTSEGGLLPGAGVSYVETDPSKVPTAVGFANMPPVATGWWQSEKGTFVVNLYDDRATGKVPVSR